MSTRTFNVAVGIPKSILDKFQRECARLSSLVYSRHARQAALNDRYGAIDPASLPKDFVASQWHLVEIAVTGLGAIEKFVVRRALDDKRDLVMVIMPDGFIKTLWINLSSDNHATLNLSRVERS